MAVWDESFTAEQTAAATIALRRAVGLPPAQFGTEQFIAMISDEIEQLRAAGKTDRDIADILFESVGIRLESDAIGLYYAEPHERGAPS